MGRHALRLRQRDAASNRTASSIPDNQLRPHGRPQRDGGAALNLKAENETLRLTARPSSSPAPGHVQNDGRNQNDAYLSQWQIRLRAAEAGTSPSVATS